MNESSYWWRLPGPANYVEAVTASLRREINVALCLPDYLLAGLPQAISREFEETRRWESLRATGTDEPGPVQLLSRSLNLPPGVIRNAQTLCATPAFDGRIIWLEVPDEAGWPAWREFLDEYQDACRLRDKPGRTVFCVALKGRLTLDPPPAGEFLARHYWQGCVGSLDITIFAAELFRQHPLNRQSKARLQKKATIAVAASLAQYDPLLVEWLALEPLERLLDLPAVKTLLRTFGQARGWQSDQAQEWRTGMKDEVEGIERVHSAVLALNDQTTEIEARIWSGQIGVLFPFIEEQRQIIIESAEDFSWTIGQVSNGETIRDEQELEINHIASQLESAPPAARWANQHLLRRAQTLREIRNRLAHRKPIAIDQLKLCDEINLASTRRNGT